MGRQQFGGPAAGCSPGVLTHTTGVDSDGPNLSTPLTIGPLTLKNRVVMAPMTTLLDLEEGQAYRAFYAARAAGGAALVVLNLQALWPGTPGGAGNPGTRRLFALNEDSDPDALTGVVELLHNHGSAVSAQLATGSRWAPEGPGSDVHVLTPSGLVPAGDGFRPDAAELPFFPRRASPVSATVLRGFPHALALAARRAGEAGFDAVQLTAAGGSVLGQFLSPILNRRTDAYGGNLANRAHLLLESLAAVRAAIGRRLALTVRINGDDLHPDGMNARDYAELVPMLEAVGADAIDVMPGGFVSRQPVNQACVPEGTFLSVSAFLRRAARVPVSAGTRISEPVVAQQALDTCAADFVSIGTALIADPDWVSKVISGAAATIRPCTACCGCWNDLAAYHRPIRCAVNPRAGLEWRGPEIVAPARYLRVVVVGAGPAGMTAATTSARMGHDTVLVDRHEVPGGQLMALGRLLHKGSLERFRTFLDQQLLTSGAVVRPGVEATAATILAERPDRVILATGSREEPSPYASPTWQPYSCVTLLALPDIPGSRAVVIGSNRDACEVAEWLAGSGTRVELVTEALMLAADTGPWNRWVLADRVARAGVRVHLGVSIVSADSGGVVIEEPGGVACRVVADLVVHAGRRVRDDRLARALEGVAPVVWAVASEEGEQGVGDAVRAGFDAAMGLATD
jgi:2,4-dienoyl-CoA reductase-like NADH-dependent reductase (Old Yellow Enzyme family)/NADPH-dependent 2,4-dienoyl-CoA reductase/sulfur reductase-like enzyme